MSYEEDVEEILGSDDLEHWLDERVRLWISGSWEAYLAVLFHFVGSC